MMHGQKSIKLVTDVSGQTIHPPCKGQAVHDPWIWNQKLRNISDQRRFLAYTLCVCNVVREKNKATSISAVYTFRASGPSGD